MRSLVLRATLLLGVAAAPVVALACGSGGVSSESTSSGTGGTGGAHTSTGSLGGSTIGVGGNTDHGDVVELEVTPGATTLTLMNGAPGSQQFQAIAHYKDGFTMPISPVWGATNLAVGKITGQGLFNASGAQGGQVTITASDGVHVGKADLTVKLYVLQNPGGIDSATQATLKGASMPDASVAWVYPYDKTVFPRGIGGPPLMWSGGGAGDAYYIHVTSSTFELEAFASAPGSRFDWPAGTWDMFTASTSGAASLQVSRFANNAATVVVDQHHTIAPAQMRGTIYYWAINTGRVMRIKPGATAPDDFLGGGTACPSCHTVSANGQKLVMSTGDWPNTNSVTFDLQKNANDFSGFGVSTGASQWSQPAVSADGAIVVENFAPLRGPIGTATGAFDATTGAAIPGTGLDGLNLWMPAFSPDNKLLAYVDGADKALKAFDWDGKTKMASNQRDLVPAGVDPTKSVLSFPTATPDHALVVYQRSNDLGSLGNASDLYATTVANPGSEVALDALNGATYPFFAGDRDRHWNYEPTFAPVAAGGYFWIVFHSRRTFGTQLTGPAYSGEGSGTKQLWVAAIDQSPAPGQDPSHPAFHLEGQDASTLNMRGYWALDPCKGDGQGCMTGTECCGGYCDDSGDGGMSCKSSSGGCSKDGDKCGTAADCCDPNASCINNVCSQAPPK